LSAPALDRLGRRPPRRLGLFAFAAVLALSTACAHRSPDLTVRGAYQFEDGRLMTVAPSDGDTLRYRDLESGRSQRLYPAGPRTYQTGLGWASPSPVELEVRFQGDGPQVNGLEWRPKAGTSERAEKLQLREEPMTFRSGDVTLSGRLVLPPGEGPHPAIVLVHGSERDAAAVYYHDPYVFASQGIATLVYDKRGTGGSEGKFVMNFDKLADDALAAVERVRKHPAIDPARIGLCGSSQGGWIAPLAATRSDAVRFVLVRYGLAESPAQEDRNEALDGLRAKGYGEAEIRKAEEVVAAVHEVLRSRLGGGWRELKAVKRKYQGEPWLRDLEGEITGAFVRYPAWILRTYGRPRILGIELDWFYEPGPVLEKVDVPLLWMVGGKDEEAPPEITLATLRRLQAGGRPVEVELFPDADHGILEFEVQDGRRVYTRYAPGYFRKQVDWVRRQVGLEP
jgi:dipeptidyl aminopeptidase/acylaminoacyl peptidase